MRRFPFFSKKLIKNIAIIGIMYGISFLIMDMCTYIFLESDSAYRSSVRIFTSLWSVIYAIFIFGVWNRHGIQEYREEKERTNEIINSLSDSCDAICYIDIKNDSMIDYRKTNALITWEKEFGVATSYKKRVTDYAEYAVHPEDRRLFKSQLMPENIVEKLKIESFIEFKYRTVLNDKIEHYKARVVRDNSVKKRFNVIVTFIDMNKEYTAKKIKEDALFFEQAMHSSLLECHLLMYINFETGYARMLHPVLWQEKEQKKFVDVMRFNNNSGRIHEDDRDNIMKYVTGNVLQEALKENGSYTGRHRQKIEGKEGFRWCQVIFTPFEYKDNIPISAIMRIQDIDDVIEEEKRHSMELNKALEKAKNASNAKTSFLFNMSHDIRTPMNAIIGFNDIARKNIDNKEKVIDALEKANIANHQMLDIVNDVLEMARIENNKIESKEDVIDMEQHWNSIVDMFTGPLQKKNIEFVTNLEYQDRYVVGDGTHMMQVIDNLASNALKFTPAGGKIIMTSTQIGKTEDGFALWEVRVKDNGIGISDEFQNKLFDSFERERTSTVSGSQGTGLGLAISRRYAMHMGGDIVCNSKLGEGSEFIFTFKMKIGDVDKLMESSKKTVEDANLEGIKILLVEDNELNREIAQDVLGEKGAIVDVAVNGAQAVSKVAEASKDFYDVILMDIQMPVMDGYRATHEIRNLDNSLKAAVPIIALTANAFEEDKQNALNAGMNGFVAKPIKVDELVKELGRLM